MFEILLITILVLFAIGGIWAFVVTKKVKEEGIEADAVVSRVELHEWSSLDHEFGHDSVTEEYYITYRNLEGQNVEAMLTNPGDYKFQVGDRMKIKYLPDRQEYPVLVEIR